MGWRWQEAGFGVGMVEQSEGYVGGPGFYDDGDGGDGG